MGLASRNGRRIGRIVTTLAIGWLAVLTPCEAAEYLIADQASDRIVAVDATSGAYTRTLWSAGAHVQPSALSFGPNGDLFIVNRLSGDVLRIAQANLGGSFVTANPFVAGIAFPGSITYHQPSQSLLVGEFGRYPGGPLGDNIFVYNSAAVLQATLTLPEVGIAGLAFDGAGNLYASGFYTDEFASGRIYKFGGPPAWTPQGPFAPDPYPMAELQGAAGIAFNSAGDMYVAGLITFNAGNVVKFSIDQGQVVGQQQLGEGLPFPSGLLMLPEGHLLATSLGFGLTSGAVYRLNPENGARSVLLKGDFNQDGVVSAADLTKWRSAIEVDATADADFDGDSDGDDFLAWQRGLGNQGPPGLFSPSSVVLYDPSTAVSVPEPAMGFLATCASAVLATLRKRCRG